MAHLEFHSGMELSREALQGAITQHEMKALSSFDQQAGLLSLGLPGDRLPVREALGANI